MGLDFITHGLYNELARFRSIRGGERRGPLVHAHAHQPLILGALPVRGMHEREHAVHPTHGKCAEEQGLVRMCVDKRSAALATTN